MKRIVFMAVVSSLLTGSLSMAGGADYFSPSNDTNLGMRTITLSAAIALAGATTGITIGKAFAAEAITPEVLNNSIGKLREEIGQENTSNLVQAMNNCNDPDSISVPVNALTAQKVVSAYSQAFDKCMAK